jgi:hypothetical protein
MYRTAGQDWYCTTETKNPENEPAASETIAFIAKSVIELRAIHFFEPTDANQFQHGNTFGLLISTTSTTCRNPVTAVPTKDKRGLRPGIHRITANETTGKKKARTNQAL